MKKWNMVVDVARCHDCNNCFLACKDEFDANDYPPYSVAQPRHGHRWINVLRTEKGQNPKVRVAYLPLPCMHCDSAPCVEGSKGGEAYKRQDGIVVIDPQKAKGFRELVSRCPYGAIYWNEERNAPQKCTFCVHLLEEGWEEPRCVQACPTGALKVYFAGDPEMKRLIAAENLEVYRPEHRTAPRVYYKNLYRYTRGFIAGSVALQDRDECAEGAKVTLAGKAAQIMLVTLTDNYGDFSFDNLEENGSKYVITVEYPGYEKQTREVTLEKSLNIGTIFL